MLTFVSSKLDFLDKLSLYIESLIFATDKPISEKQIKAALDTGLQNTIEKKQIDEAIHELKEKYQQDTFSFEIRKIAGGYQFMTKPSYYETIGQHLKLENKKRLSRAMMETLSIIAYKQPVIKSEIEHIRGVASDYTIQKLLEKELVEISGRSDTPGKPLLYTTSEKFMDHFGIDDLTELPKLKEFKTEENQIGEQAPIEESE